jgi:hypothetical protein
MRMLCAALVFAMTAAVVAQEGISTLPKNYRLQFENAWVKVTSVRYGPLEKLAGHAHTPNPAAYVYLNDGGPVIFRHVGGSAATRAATNAGAFRMYRGLEEVHEVENTANVPSEFLRIELKTEGREPAAFRGKFERPAAAATEVMVHVDHPQLRVSRLWVQPGQRLAVRTGAEPSLVIALGPLGGHPPGHEWWVESAGSAELFNNGAAAVDVLRFDFKTPPMASTR